MQNTPLASILIVSSIVFALAGVMQLSLSWLMTSMAILSFYIYARHSMALDIAAKSVEIDRTALGENAYSGEALDVRIEYLNNGLVSIVGEFEDIVPEGCALAEGINKFNGALPPRRLARLSYSVVPERRGVIVFKGSIVTMQDAYGLFSETDLLEKKTFISIHIRKESLETARRLAGREHLEFSGFTRKMALVMRELEFDTIRDYIPGDRARDIHWKYLSKLDKLMTKVFRKEGALQTTIIVDCSTSMRRTSNDYSKLDHAVDISIQLSRVLLSSYHAAGVALMEELRVIDAVEPSLGRGQFERIVHALRLAPGTVPAAEELPEAFSINSLQRTEMLARDCSSSTESEKLFEVVSKLGSVAKPGRLGSAVGLDGLIVSTTARNKGQKQLFIVLTDLVSSRDAVLAGARICQRSGNKMLVMHTYPDWYEGLPEPLDMAESERAYEHLVECLKIEARLRRYGASYLRIGPADSTTKIVRALRRGRA